VFLLREGKAICRERVGEELAVVWGKEGWGRKKCSSTL